MLNFKILSESLEELDAHLARAMETGYLFQNFDKEICDNVRRLNKLIGFIPQAQPADVIIDHPKMVEIRAVAGKLRESLRGQAD